MIRAIFLLCVFSRVNLEMHTFQHQVYISRKSRSNANPTHTGFIYSRVNKDPGIMTTFDNSYRRSTEKYSEYTTKKPINNGETNVTSKTNTTEHKVNWSSSDQNKGILGSSSKQNEDHAKAETKCQPSKGKEAPDTIAKHTKTALQYDESPNSVKNIFVYDTDKQFRMDDEDVRTDSRNSYNDWPYSYHGPYEYQINNFQEEKAKDKRFLGTDSRAFIPVHENLEDDVPYSPVEDMSKAEYKDSTTDNPNYGNQPFFSSVLSDYYERHQEEDPLVFKDFSWAEEFDNGIYSHDIDDNDIRSKRLHDNKFSDQMHDTKTANGETATEKAYDNSREYSTYLKGDKIHDHQGSEHDYNGHRQTEFKDFVNTFANKFGSEDQNKNSKFMLKQNQDKGEKRKGFRRVYHKDEYQEDNEFYDNSNKNAQAQENGGSNFKSGGSQAALQTHAAALGGNENNYLARKGSKDDTRYEKSNNRKERRKGNDGEISRYTDIAKNVALSNNADYIDLI